MALDEPRCFAQDLGPPPKREARAPQAAMRGGRERPPRKGLIVQGQLTQDTSAGAGIQASARAHRTNTLDKILGPPPAWRGPRPEARLVADCIPREGADKVVPGEGVAEPRSRLVWEQGVPVARLIPAACGHAGGEDHQVHAVQAVQELVPKSPLHPVRQPEGEEARPP